MKTTDVLVVNIYITEASHLLNTIMNYLKNEAGIQGVSVFRAISGYSGTSSHSAALIDLALDLPLLIAFFDEKCKVQPALEHLSTLIKSERIVFWEAKANF